MLNLTLLPLVGLLCFSTAATSQPNPEHEALYKQRFETLIRDGGVVTNYDPMEPVSGAKNTKPLTIAAKPSISGSALESATAYAKANNSSAFIVWMDGKIQTQSFFGDIKAETPLVSKSLSKPLTAIAVGRAIALGQIKSLDQPVADFIPEWKSTPKAAILVRHLLDMRSGLLEQMVSTDPDHPINRAYIDPDHGGHLIENYPLTHTPGSYYGYSNATSELVAIVIERATGQRYADFIGKEILAPIGAPGGRIWVNRPDGLAHSGCCMYLPAESWLRLGILLAEDGKAKGRRLLPKGYVRAMRTATPQNPHYGLGLWVAGPYAERRGFGAVGKPGPKVLHSEPYLDRDLVLFDGNSNQVIYISPSTRLVILRMGNTPPRSPEWDNAALPNMIIRGMLDSKKAARLTPQK